MRMSDRILLILIGILDILAGVFVLLDIFTSLWESKLDFILKHFLTGTMTTAAAIFAVAVFIIVGTSLLIIAINSLKYSRVIRDDVVSILKSENGDANVTFEAVRVIANKRCMTLRSVSNCMTLVDIGKGGALSVRIKVRPMPNVSLPELAGTIQQGVKEAIYEQTGIDVGKVSVLMLPCEKKIDK